MFQNLHLIENQPRWRVAVLIAVAAVLGVVFKVEGYPFGRMGRQYKKWLRDMPARNVTSVGRLGST